MSPSDYYECHTTHPQDNNQEADYLAIFINLHLSSWIKQRSGRRLEIVGRFNYTGLNDIVAGEYYNAGRGQYYPGGEMQDWPYNSSSVGGGNVRSYTIGANYSANRFVLFMLDYTYSRLTKDFLPYDKNFHSVQARVQFVF